MRVTRCEEAPSPPRSPGARGAFEEALERTAAAAANPAGPRPAEPALPELREVARAVPPAIWAGRVGRERTVELAFGRGIEVALRQAPGGIELELRAAPALARAARTDLPALVEALRARGVTVLRAEVRGCPGGGGATPRRSASR